jgi:hypothetical protein
MYWKLPRKEFNAGQGEGNRLDQKAIVASGRTPGLLAYVDGVPAGRWAVEPRAQPSSGMLRDAAREAGALCQKCEIM